MTPETSAAETPTLGHYLTIIRQRQWIIFVLMTTAALGAVVISLLGHRQYSASAEVLLKPQAGASTPSAVTLDRAARTEARLARLPVVAQRALRAAQVPGRSLESFLASTTVSIAPDDDILTFQVQDPKPRVAMKLATAYARQFTIFRPEIDARSVALQRESVEARIHELVKRGETTSPLYATLVNKDLELQSEQAAQTTDAVFVGAADTAERVSGRLLRAVMLALGLGLILGIAAVFGLEAIQQPVRSVREIGSRLGLPLLASLPPPRPELARGNGLATIDEPNGPNAEMFRVLRFNLDFFNLRQGAGTILITSPLPGDGKSTTAANLAVVLARAGQRVVLVDLDLRHPSLARIFDVREAPGIADVVLGRATVTDVLVTVDVSQTEQQLNPADVRGAAASLLLMPSGVAPRDVGEFFAREHFGHVLAGLSEAADVVLIDSSPLLGVGDARSLSTQVDAIIVVTQPIVLRRAMLEELVGVLRTCPAMKLGYVATHTEPTAVKYYDYHRRAPTGLSARPEADNRSDTGERQAGGS